MQSSSLILCTDANPDSGLIDFTIAPDFLYYAYLPIIIIALGLGIFVVFKDKFSLISRALLLITIIFSIFIANELIQWIIVPAGMIYFQWALSLLLHFLLVVSTIYFVLLFVLKKDIPFIFKLLLFAITLPVIVLLPTDLNLVGFDINWCGAKTGPLWIYLYGFEFLTALGFLTGALYLFYQKTFKNKINLLPSIYLLIAAALFLLVFLSSYFFADYTGIYDINFIGPVGMLIFICVLSYIIVQFKAFNIKFLTAQALMIFLWLLIGSMLFITQSTATRLVVIFTLVAAIVLGIMLVRSIFKTVKQKEEIEKLADKLESANERLKVLDKMKSEFVSIASHQLRSPLTSIRGYSSMLLEGSYGKLSPKAQDAVSRIHESSRFMASSVEDYLNVSRIQAGNMKYVYSDFNLKDIAEQVADDTRSQALKKGLLVTFKSDMTKKGIVHADIGKTRQVIDNLINNAMKYTLKGSISIFVHDVPKQKKIYVDIKDTGIGMSQSTIENMFEKFERASNANEVNVTGTGLGLYIARKMSREMGGDVTAHSEGEGKGSTFRVELTELL